MTSLCDKKDTPIVLVGDSSNKIQICNVNIDHKAIGTKLANLALDLGYKRIVLIRGNKKLKSSAIRIDAFKKVLKKQDRGKIIANLTGILGHDQGRKAMKDIMKLKPKPDLVLCSSDLTALGILDGATTDFNLDVPKDLAIIGFGDAPISSWGMNRLTTVQLPTQIMIDESIDCLFHQIKNPHNKAKSVMLNSTIILRDTTKKL
jgi:DNA-binding LacI/PurR family transcriptional regulator